MKTVLKKIFKFFVNLFKSSDMKVEIFNILMGNCDSPELKELRDADLMNKAWELVKELHVRTDLVGLLGQEGRQGHRNHGSQHRS